MLVKKRPFRSQDSWSQASVDDNCESLALRPSLPKIPALLDSAFPGPTPNPATPEAKTITQLLPPCSRSKQPFENKFKDYMDILHMQCWLKTKTRYDDKGNRLFGVEIEIQNPSPHADSGSERNFV
ncbi:unnamed protein product [Allacma fusca]|uniref:Uncharacterized protein n=1 Tax=Allacma fusca TaxID=39272 RepID=A0A8J2K2G2_9HEXA|nr:unnamed protein product [Allacma fusca]